MAGRRVFELAKEFDMSSKELLVELDKLGIEVSSHMAALDDKVVNLVRGRLRKKKEEMKKVGESFKGIKSTAKTILIKKKVKPRVVEEPAAAASTVEAPVLPEEAVIKKEEVSEVEKKAPEEKVIEEVIEEKAAEATGDIVQEAGAAGKAEEVALPEVTGEEPQEKKPVAEPIKEEAGGRKKEAGVEAAVKAKEQRKKGIKIIAREPDEDLFVSHKWKSFKAIPRREKRAKPFGSMKRPRTAESGEITKPRKKVIKLYEGTTVKEFADLIGQKTSDIMAKLIEMGMMATINQPIDMDAAILIAEACELKVEVAAEKKLEEYIEEVEDSEELLKPRAPVVTVMGHVDHGKTSLLDAVRKTNVTEAEAGGITQHIGAYVIETGDKRVVFLDTPGHEAFTAMRARGAKVTDIVILVVAADDGVMPQTIEAINHAKAANVPIIVAINKIDKPGANPERVKQELSNYGLLPESWGGQTIFVEVSAKQRTGLENLLDMVLLQAEVLELKANPDKSARGVILEAKLDRGRGPVATVLVQNGTLNQGDYFVCGSNYGRVRVLLSDKAKPLQSAPPATPVEVIGFSGVSQAGDAFVTADDEHIAKSIATARQQKQRIAGLEKSRKVTLDELYTQIKDGVVRELNIIIKADVHGSAEAVSEALERLGTEAVKVRIIHGGVGGITETDIMLASASNAIIIGFNVRPEPKALALAEKEEVDIRLYNIIYDAVADIKAAMEGLLEPTIREQVTGRAEVRQVFSLPKRGSVAGSYVLDGTISRACAGIRLIRDNVEIYKGKIGSLRRFKDDVRDVQAGYECGITIENFNDMKAGDIIEAFVIEKVAAKL